MVAVGEVMPAREFTITRADLIAYANASGDQNPIHQDDAFALSVGLPGVIAHGMYTMGLVGRAVTEWAGTTSLREFSVRFTRPVVVGNDGAVLTVSGVVKNVDATSDLVTVDVTALFEGQTVLSRAKAIVQMHS